MIRWFFALWAIGVGLALLVGWALVVSAPDGNYPDPRVSPWVTIEADRR